MGRDAVVNARLNLVTDVHIVIDSASSLSLAMSLLTAFVWFRNMRMHLDRICVDALLDHSGVVSSQ